MASFLTSLLSEYHLQLERHRNRPFLEATMAACALVAVADGEISFGERIRIDQILNALDRLKVFDPHEAVNLFNQFSSDIFSAPKAGRERAIAALKLVSEHPESAALLMRIFMAICEIGETKSLVKQIEVVMLCGLLDIKPDDFGLYVDDGADAFLKDNCKKSTIKPQSRHLGGGALLNLYRVDRTSMPGGCAVGLLARPTWSQCC